MRHLAPIHRFSSFACAALASVLFQPGVVSAVALGNIALQSSLGQPLRVVIPVAMSTGEVLDTSCLRLVRDAEAGIPQLLTGRVNIERHAAGTRLIVTTPRPMNEPTLRVTVEAGCGNTVRRDYVLLLDPQGTGREQMLASADVDEFRNYAAAAPPATARHAKRVAAAPVAAPVLVAAPVAAPVRLAKADPAPSPTTFTSIAALVPVAAATPRALKPVAPAPVVNVVPPSAPPVTLATAKAPSGFITEAAAASLSNVSVAGLTPVSNTSANSPQAALLRAQTPAPEETLWTQTWPYAAILLSIVAIALTAFAKRRGAIVPAWGAPTQLNDSRSPMGSTGHPNTFAHFGVMTEPAPIVPRNAMAYPTVAGDSTYDASLDTLLEQAQDDPIDLHGAGDDEVNEHTVRKAWATLANESAVDIGTDSILKAIAEAERDLRIGPPDHKQAAIDKALDDDLLRVSKART